MKKCKPIQVSSLIPTRIKVEHVIIRPLEIGVKYKTKFATNESVTVVEDIYYRDKNEVITGVKTQIKVIYENSPHLGACPLSIDRIIPEQETIFE